MKMCVRRVKIEALVWSYNLVTRRELVKLFIEVPRQRFWLTFTFLLENISGLIIKIPFNPNKDIVALGFELNFQ